MNYGRTELSAKVNSFCSRPNEALSKGLVHQFTRQARKTEETLAYSKKDHRKAVNLSALLGWLAVAPLFVLEDLSLLPWTAVFGLPIAFGSSWLVGAPILRQLMKHPISWLSAGFWGGVIAAIIAAIFVAIRLLQGGRQSPSLSLDSMANGFWIFAQDTKLFILLGIAIALIVRWRIGPGTRPNEDLVRFTGNSLD